MKITLRPTRRQRWIAALSLGLLLVVLEWFCRARLGLGDPPLSRADPQIEYLFVGPRVYHRFGHTIEYNEFSQRTHAISARRSDPRELRILVCGDSVINGGALTDQSELATTLLEQRLARDFQRPATVMNISAGSWGPPNYWAYLQRYGFFEADALVVVVSSHDFADAPTFTPVVGVDPDYPDKSPTFALEEALTRYLPRYLPHFHSGPVWVPAITQGEIDQAMGAFNDLVAAAQGRHLPLIVAQHLEQAERGKPESEGHAAFRKAAEAKQVRLVQLGDAYDAAIKAGKQPYRDNIHPNAVGQSLMAEAIYPSLADVLRGASTAPATAP